MLKNEFEERLEKEKDGMADARKKFEEELKRQEAEIVVCLLI